jgi:vacuolar-type H+-ATPase subunit F/Vma7
MELSVRVLCTSDVAAGFELAGIAADKADESGAGDVLKRLTQDPEVGVVLVEERLRRAIPEEVRQRIDRQAWPIVVSFPSPVWEGPSAAEEYVLELLRQAVGYRVRPR